MKAKKIITMVSVLVVMLIFTSCEIADGGSSPDVGSGYIDAVFEKVTDKGDAFLACGADGRLDRIYEDGVLENISLPIGDSDLTSILITKDITIVAGTSGAIAHSRDGIKFELSSGADKEHILGLAQFNGQFYACTYSGKILSSDDGISWKTGEKLSDKPLIAIAANNLCIMAITEDSDIIKSQDGANWDTQNYNTVYYGLAEEQSFTSIVNLNENMYVIGQIKNQDAPSLMYSSDGGEIWKYISSVELNHLPPEEFYPINIYSVDFLEGELLAACNSGRIMSYTDCPSCNTIVDIQDVDMRCISVSDNIVLVAGDNFEFSVLSVEEYRNLSDSAGQSDMVD